MKRGLLVLLVGGIAVTLVSRKERPFPEAPRDEFRAAQLQSSARVIFITLDGPVRDDVLTGPHMPGLQAAVRKEGVAFAATTSAMTAMSLPGYQTMAAGALTGCRDNDCARIQLETMAETIARTLHLAPEDVALFASWSRFSLAATSRDAGVFLDLPADGPPHDGGPRWKNARFDAVTFSAARAHWQTHRPRFMHLAFLDTDEWAHLGLRTEYEQALRETDARIVEVLQWVAALPPEEAALTTVLLASDHGRGRADWTRHGLLYPGSTEIFVAAIGPLVKRGAAAQVDQRDLRPTVQRLFGLCPARVNEDGRAIEAIIGGLPCGDVVGEFVKSGSR
ncbi:MAG: hypothetical protein Q8K32_32195 [Archangium sp.]|nr:hypothetical protein [Archangium sp.]